MLSVLSELEGSCTALERQESMEKMSHPESPLLKEESLFWEKHSTEVQKFTPLRWSCYGLVFEVRHQQTNHKGEHFLACESSVAIREFSHGPQATADTKERLAKHGGGDQITWKAGIMVSLFGGEGGRGQRACSEGVETGLDTFGSAELCGGLQTPSAFPSMPVKEP